VKYEQRISDLEDKLRISNSKYKAALREATFQDKLIEEIATRITPFQPVAAPAMILPDQPGLTRESAVLLLSDWHFWEEVILEEVGGLNEYNMHIATAYMEYLAGRVVSIIQSKLQGYTVSDLNIFMLGDFVSTNIHEILQHSQGTAVDSLLQGQYLLGMFLLDMARAFPQVNVYGVVGNHGRLQEKKKYSKRYANWDYVLYNELAMMLSLQENISFCFPKSFFQIVEVAGNTFCLLHGDDIRMWNQIPWYGIDRAVRRFYVLLSKKKNINVDYWCLGHFHNTGLLQGVPGRKLINGSAIGMSNFSLGKLFTGNEPEQTIFGINEGGNGEYDYSGITWRYDIEMKAAPPTRYVIDEAEEIHRQWRQILSG